MNRHFFLAFSVIVCSCSNSSNEMNQELDNSIEKHEISMVGCEDINTSEASLTMIAEKQYQHDIELVQLREVSRKVDDKYVKIRIETSGIPNLFEYNSSYIDEGYCEFAMAIVFRNKMDSVDADNIVLEILRYKSDSIEKSLESTFEDFLMQCERDLFAEYSKTPNDISTYKTEHLADGENIYVACDNNAIEISFELETICPYFENYFTHGFQVIMTLNRPEAKGENKFVTEHLNSDSWVRHYFLHDNARKMENVSNK